ncbi:hypothetical protein FRX31_012772 [Thalictrum thalictroides]|uniref:Uncharacterized protein n=1 Tax=Thalictrum thalictroides TaxID=46969 RepID=A0A7J6WJW0_THATH|nr:hypothetical protein FRX31_012772 [Thalictrum thalictroides]
MTNRSEDDLDKYFFVLNNPNLADFSDEEFDEILANPRRFVSNEFSNRVRANPAVELISPSVRFDEDSVGLDRDLRMNSELSLSNAGNFDKTVITELEEVSSERDEDELTVDSDVELASSIPCDDDDVQDEAGPICTPDDGNDNEASQRGFCRLVEVRCTYLGSQAKAYSLFESFVRHPQR